MTATTEMCAYRLTALFLLIALAAAGQDAQPPGSFPDAEAASQDNTTQGADLVVGLNALNRQLLDALAGQPTRRLIILPFPDSNGELSPLSDFIRQQLITAVAATGEFEIVPDSDLLAAAKQYNIHPIELADTDVFRQASQRYVNDIIIAGSITDLGSKVAVMARLISGRSSQYTGGAIVYLSVTGELAGLLRKSDEPEAARDDHPAGQQTQQEPEETKGEETAESEQMQPQDEADTQPKPAVESPAAPDVEGMSDLEIYRRGRALMEEKKFQQAILYFEEMVKRFPESALADNGVYWIGECRYARQEWRAALEAFQRVLDQYPYGNKVPSATLKLGYTRENLGDIAGAIASMEEVIKRFGDSSEVDIAKRKLQLLRAQNQQ